MILGRQEIKFGHHLSVVCVSRYDHSISTPAVQFADLHQTFFCNMYVKVQML
jgi:hypothetical protein